jgi:hypothetical protein
MTLDAHTSSPVAPELSLETRAISLEGEKSGKRSKSGEKGERGAKRKLARNTDCITTATLHMGMTL